MVGAGHRLVNGSLAYSGGVVQVIVWSPQRWRERQAEHQARVDAAIAGHLERRRTGRAHPVEDFLWVYYRLRPAQLRRWHPGPGIVLAASGPDPAPHLGWRHYRACDADGRPVAADAGTSAGAGHVRLDVPGFRAARGEAIRAIVELLEATAARPPSYGCFGLHEWAMVYRSDDTRHQWPLRLGAHGTDEVVRSRPLRCTHYDAFRFFTPAAEPLNEFTPTARTRPRLEQPGCLHAGMDLYKWAYTLAPGVPSELVMDCFEHARAAREIDMRASPYDLRELGYAAIPIETPEGRATYVQEQRRLAQRAATLRDRLLQVARALLADPSDAGPIDARPVDSPPADGRERRAQRSPCGP